ncbi:LppU/SCO3897 family protein [Streptomyces lydicus]
MTTRTPVTQVLGRLVVDTAHESRIGVLQDLAPDSQDGSEDDNTLQMTIVGCDSSEAQYKTAEVLTGAQECKPETARAISLRGRNTVSTRWCFTKV